MKKRGARGALLWTLGAVFLSLWAVMLMPGVRTQPALHYKLASWYLGFPLLLAGVSALMLWFSLRAQALGEGSAGKAPPAPRRRKGSFGSAFLAMEAGALVLVTLVAAFFRTTRLQELPTGFFFDEAQNGIEAMKIMEQIRAGAWGELPIYIERLSQNAALYMYQIALSFELFGVSTASVRLVSIVSGVAAAPLFYLLARGMMGLVPALAGALFLAVMRWHFNFSRVGFLGVQTVLFEIAALYFLWRAVHNRRWWDFAGAGAFLGLGMHSYIASRAVPLVFILWGIYLLLISPSREKARGKGRRKAGYFRALGWHIQKLAENSQTWRDAGVLVGSALLVFAPLLPTLFKGLYFSRNKSAGIWAHVPGFENAEGFSKLSIIFTQPFWTNVAEHLLMFLYIGDGNGRHNVPGWPLLEPVLGTLFLLGVMLAVLRYRDRRGVLALILGGVMLQGGIWSIPWEAPQGYRSLGAIPAVALLAALAVEHIQKSLGLFRESGPRILGSLALVLALALSARNSYEEYFVAGPKDQGVWAGYDTVEAHIGKTLRDMKAETASSGTGFNAYFSPRYAGHPTVRFVSEGWDDFPALDLSGDLPLREVPANNLVLFLDPIAKHQVSRIRRLYPQCLIEPLASPANGEEVLYVVKISPRDVERSFGLNPASGEGEETARGSLWAPPDGRVQLRLSGKGKLRVDGRAVLLGPGETTLSLPEGLHGLELEGGNPSSLRAGPGLILRASGFGGLRRWFEPAALPGAGERPRGETKKFREGIDPVLSLSGEFSPLRGLSGPVRGVWEGSFDPGAAGIYHLGLKASGSASLKVGNLGLVESRPHESQEKEFDLKGPVPVRIEVFYETSQGHFLELFWQKPDGSRGPVPEENLRP